MRVHAICKGPSHEVYKQLDARGIKPKAIEAFGRDLRCVCDAADLPKLQRWFTEPGTAPFAPGTCLYFHADKED